MIKKRSSRERLYHHDAYNFSKPAAGYWDAVTPPLDRPCPPVAASHNCDVAIIGAGYTGLAAAEALAGRHGMDARVLEAATPGWGASGRNGGFCCLGASALPLAAIVARYGRDETRRFFDIQRSAIDGVQAFLQRHGQWDRQAPLGELSLAHRPQRLAALRRDADDLRDVLGLRVQLLDRAALAERGCSAPEFFGGALSPAGFALNPLAYARARAGAAIDAGAAIHGNSPVLDWRHEQGRHRLKTGDGEVIAKAVVVATNGYSSEILPPWLAGRTLPVMSNILVTRKLSAAEWATQGWSSRQMAFDTRVLLHYFRRLPDGRFLFGGRGGLDASPGGLAAAQRRLRRDFERMFPAWRSVESEWSWSGFACLARDLVPYVGPAGDLPNVHAALAYHGNGVAFSGWAGAAVADCVAGSDGAAERLPAVVRGPMRRFPLPALRRFYLRLAYAQFGLIDRFL